MSTIQTRLYTKRNIRLNRGREIGRTSGGTVFYFRIRFVGFGRSPSFRKPRAACRYNPAQFDRRWGVGGGGGVGGGWSGGGGPEFVFALNSPNVASSPQPVYQSLRRDTKQPSGAINATTAHEGVMGDSASDSSSREKIYHPPQLKDRQRNRPIGL